MTLGKYSVTGVINEQNLVESVETRLANNVLGDVAVRTVFSGYKDYDGVKFPSHIVQTQGGHPTLDLNVSDVQPNSAAAACTERPGTSADCTTARRRENRASEDRGRRLVSRWWRADERARRVQRSRGHHRGAAERRAHRSDDRGGEAAPAVEADSLRRQHAPALRSLGGHSSLRRGGHFDRDAREEQVVLGTHSQESVHPRARSPGAREPQSHDRNGGREASPE